MVIRNKSEQLVIRITKGLTDFIDQDIEQNQLHSNRSDWVTTAILFYRDKRMKETKDRSAPPPLTTSKGSAFAGGGPA